MNQKCIAQNEQLMLTKSTFCGIIYILGVGLMDIVSNVVSFFANLSPNPWLLSLMASLVTFGTTTLILNGRHQRFLNKIECLFNQLEKELEKEKAEHKKLREINQEKTVGNRTKTTAIHKENDRTDNRAADIEFCKKLLEKNYQRYAEDPTTIDFTLEVLSNERLLAMQSIVEKNPDPVCQNIATKIKIALVNRNVTR